MSSDYCLFELADPKTRKSIELEDGAVGELVLTSLDWEGGPMMRYAYGDIVRISTKPCECGRTGLKFRKKVFDPPLLYPVSPVHGKNPP